MLSDDYTCLTFWPPRGPRAKGRSLKKDDVSLFLRAVRGPCAHGKPTTAAREAPEGVAQRRRRNAPTTCSPSPLDSQTTSGPRLTPQAALIRPAPQVDVDDEKPLRSTLLAGGGWAAKASRFAGVSFGTLGTCSQACFSLASAYGSGLRAG